MTSTSDEIKEVRACYEDSQRAEIANAIRDIGRKWTPLFRQLQSDCEKETGHDFQDLETCVICGVTKPS